MSGFIHEVRGAVCTPWLCRTQTGVNNQTGSEEVNRVGKQSKPQQEEGAALTYSRSKREAQLHPPLRAAPARVPSPSVGGSSNA